MVLPGFYEEVPRMLHVQQKGPESLNRERGIESPLNPTAKKTGKCSVAWLRLPDFGFSNAVMN